jgi:hypothetical protein
MNYYIDQPCGLGDIFFCQKLTYLLATNDNKIIWPVNDNLLYIKNYIRNEYVTFIKLSETDRFIDQFKSNTTDILIDEKEENIYLPIKNSNVKLGRPIMESKYKFINGSTDDWQNYFNIDRNIDRENNLYYDILKLNDDSVYNVVNKKYGTPPITAIKNEVCSNNSFDNIEIDFIDGINVFDWCKVLENSRNIFTIDTCFMFIIEKLSFKHSNVGLHVWSRHNPADFFDIETIFSKNWNFIK